MKKFWSEIDRSDVAVCCGLGLIVGGLWPVFWPAGVVIAGAVLVWLALPPRGPFITGK